jgi:hypothetical protein
VARRVLDIREAGPSPVYDLECYPYHNFVASGVVVHNCHFCYAQMQSNEDGQVTRDQFFGFLEDAASIGIKGISFISDGESTMVDWYADAIEYAHDLGLAVGAGSNGIKLTKPVLERILPRLTYLRFNISAGEKKRFAEIMGVRQPLFDTVVQNIRDGMEIIRRDNLPVTLNCQIVLHPKDHDQIIPFAKMCAELAPSYSIIKHCSDNREGQLGVDYTEYAALEDKLKEAEKIGRDAGIRLAVKWNKIKSGHGSNRNYAACFGAPFILQMSGTGLIAPCGFLFASQFAAFHIGSITRQRFADIWASERYWTVMQYLASDQFDPRVRCGSLCLQDPTNEFLYAYKQGRVSLPTTEAPPHLAFL